MSSRASKRAKRALEERIAAYRSDDEGQKKPGSLNPRKSHGGRTKLRRK